MICELNLAVVLGVADGGVMSNDYISDVLVRRAEITSKVSQGLGSQACRIAYLGKWHKSG